MTRQPKSAGQVLYESNILTRVGLHPPWATLTENRKMQFELLAVEAPKEVPPPFTINRKGEQE